MAGREELAIRFPVVVGYRRELFDERLSANCDCDSDLTLSVADLPTETTEGARGEMVHLMDPTVMHDRLIRGVSLRTSLIDRPVALVHYLPEEPGDYYRHVVRSTPRRADRRLLECFPALGEDVTAPTTVAGQRTTACL